MHKNLQLTCFFLLLLASLALDAKAATNAVTYPAQNGSFPLAGQNALAGCANSVSLCGKIIPLPPGVIGTTIALTAPKPYLPQPFTVQCINVNGLSNYQITDSSAVTCTLPTCAPAALPVCGVEIPVPSNTSLGSSIKVIVPASALVSEARGHEVSFNAQCVDNGGFQPVYVASDAASVSCNLFPCPESTVKLCNTEIVIPGGSSLGTVLQMTMPKPFVADPFTVQCLGSEANAPIYQMTEHDSVSCLKAPSASQ